MALVREAAKLWRAGCDTQKIADLLKVDEAEIWNRMDRIKRS
jgi:DNA-binding CsgD family transcriptional regulator